VSSSKDRWIGVCSIGLTIPGKLSCPNDDNNNNNNNKKKKIRNVTQPKGNKLATGFRNS
jgi:hypothetical protein